VSALIHTDAMIPPKPTRQSCGRYFFGVANYFLYGESIIYYFKHIVFIDEYLIPFARHHRFISLLMYLLGFLGFVTNLDRGHLRRQFGLFSWIHMSLLLIIVFGQFMVNNILEGLIWFWVPASLVIMNDVAAYVFGISPPSPSPVNSHFANLSSSPRYALWQTPVDQTEPQENRRRLHWGLLHDGDFWSFGELRMDACLLE
jgi:hypothetical protein